MIIGGDIVPTENNNYFFSSGDLDSLIGIELKNILAKADYRIYNLEAPITDKLDPIKKCGPNLFAPSSAIIGIKALNPNLIGLANNHILDHGVEGLKRTEEILVKYDIDYIGAGKNIEEAAKPFIITFEDTKIGVYACAEHEFTIASLNEPGANPFDPLESLDHIAKLKEECNYVIVLYHGGKEYYRLPSPELKKRCRKMVEKGASLVICQHSHCICCEDRYKGGVIVYGQGNFIFNKIEAGQENYEYSKDGLLIEVIFSKDKMEVDYIPINRFNNNTIQISEKSIANKILDEFYDRSESIKDDIYVENEFRKFAVSKFNYYMINYSGKKHSLYFRILRKIVKDYAYNLVLTFRNQDYLALRNYIECEAHYEVLLTIFKEKCIEKK